MAINPLAIATQGLLAPIAALAIATGGLLGGGAPAAAEAPPFELAPLEAPVRVVAPDAAPVRAGSARQAQRLTSAARWLPARAAVALAAVVGTCDAATLSARTCSGAEFAPRIAAAGTLAAREGVAAALTSREASVAALVARLVTPAAIPARTCALRIRGVIVADWSIFSSNNAPDLELQVLADGVGVDVRGATIEGLITYERTTAPLPMTWVEGTDSEHGWLKHTPIPSAVPAGLHSIRVRITKAGKTLTYPDPDHDPKQLRVVDE